jgi:hypothetical protein
MPQTGRRGRARYRTFLGGLDCALPGLRRVPLRPRLSLG